MKPGVLEKLSGETSRQRREAHLMVTLDVQRTGQAGSRDELDRVGFTFAGREEIDFRLEVCRPVVAHAATTGGDAEPAIPFERFGRPPFPEPCDLSRHIPTCGRR